MISQILMQAELDPTLFIGGASAADQCQRAGGQHRFDGVRGV